MSDVHAGTLRVVELEPKMTRPLGILFARRSGARQRDERDGEHHDAAGEHPHGGARDAEGTAQDHGVQPAWIHPAMVL